MPPSRLEWAGIALGLAGVLLLTRGQGFSGSLTGLLAITLACVTWCAGSVWALHGLPGGRKLTLAPGAAGYASQMLVGGALAPGAAVAAGCDLSAGRSVGAPPRSQPTPEAARVKPLYNRV